MLISFIVPVFNREGTIIRCLDSIINSFSENFKSFQIIVIDDYSNDNSLKISNIKYIHK